MNSVTKCRGWAVPALVGLAIALSPGCASYREVPLNEAAVDRALQQPSPAVLEARAASLDHPLLKPIELDPTKGLTPDEAALLSVLLNPGLRAVRDERAMAGVQLMEAGLLPDPSLSADMEVPAGGDTAGTVEGYGLQLSWDVTSLISRAARRQAARAHAARVDLEVAWKEWQVAQAARGAVWQLVSLRQQIDLADETASRLDDLASSVREAVQRGSASDRDLAEVESPLSDARIALLRLEGAEERQRQSLRLLLGLAPDAPLQIRADLDVPSRYTPPTGDELLEGLQQRRLDLLALKRGYESSEASERAAILGQFPPIEIGPSVGRDVENVVTQGLAAVVHLPIFGGSRAAIARARASRRQLFDTYTARVAAARTEVDTIASGIRYLDRELAVRGRVLAWQDSLLARSDRAVSSGRMDRTAWLAVWRRGAETRMHILVLRNALTQSIVALECVTGRYSIPDAASQNSPPSADSKGAM